MAHHIVDSVLQLSRFLTLTCERFLCHLFVLIVLDQTRVGRPTLMRCHPQCHCRLPLCFLDVREAVMGDQTHIGSDQQTRSSRECQFSTGGRSRNFAHEGRPHSKCRPRRRASLLHCTLDLGSVVVVVRRSLRHDKASDFGASWGAQSSTFFTLKHLCGLQNRLLDEGCVARVGSALPIIDIVYVDDLMMLIVAASLPWTLC